jgi:hypothetical protein
MRFSFSHLLSEAEMVEAARRIAQVVGRLRETPLEPIGKNRSNL